MTDIADELALMFETVDTPPVAQTPTAAEEGVPADATTAQPVEQAPQGGEPQPQVEPWKAEMEAVKGVQNTILEKLDLLLSGGKAQPETPPEPAAQEPKTTSSPEFVSTDDFDKIIGGDVAVFNAVLNKAVKYGFEQAMLAVPEAVQNRVMAGIDSKTQIRQYFTDNPDLYPHRKILGVIANDLVEQRPELARDAGKLLLAAGEDLRKRFNLPVPAKTPTATAPAPKTPTDAGGRTPAPKAKPEEKPRASTNISDQIAAQFDN